MYLALRVQKWFNAPVPGQKLAPKVSKSPICPWGQPPGMAADKCLKDVEEEFYLCSSDLVSSSTGRDAGNS